MKAVRVQFLSDLHIDVDPLSCPISLVEDVEVVVVAGDICEGVEKGFAWLRSTFGEKVEIVTVAGNHTFYRRCLPQEIELAKTKAPSYGIHFLENEPVELFGVTFVGTTLWTDYLIFGDAYKVNCMYEANTKMMDHKRISWNTAPWQRFRAQEALMLHRKAIDFLETEVVNDDKRKFVVVSHHAPAPKSILPLFQDSLLSAAYASDLSILIDKIQPTFWLHGHVHNSCDYAISNTRIVCNPHGYGAENSSFDPKLIIEI